MLYKTNLIAIIMSSLQKYKNQILLKTKSNKDIQFIFFLWKKGFIYGFHKLNKNQVIVFLKYNPSTRDVSFIFTKINTIVKKKKLLKEKKWSKNSFFLVKTKTGFSCEKIMGKNNIGGFLLGKIF